MGNINSSIQQNNYDPRWFIWTIVFLVVTGISLVSYIVLSENGANEIDPVLSAKAVIHNKTK